jgi:hypothetical protein
MVADNDLGLGQIVDTISHSPIWSSSAIFVVDDESTPMYDAFTSTPANAEPYDALPESTNLLDRNPNTAYDRRMTRGLDFTHLDAVPQHTFDNALWKYVHGRHSKPPPAGPNADAGADAADGDD